MFVNFFLLLSFFQFINLSKKDFSCRNSDINRKIEIGDEVTLCLHSKELKRKVAFKLKVDEYTIVTISDGYEKLFPEEKNTTNNEQESNNMRYRRRMVYDPNNGEEEQKNIEENELTTPSPPTTSAPIPTPPTTSAPTSSTTSAPTPSTTPAPTPTSNPTTITDIPTIEPTEEIIIDNPDDRSKIVAQIGDKITQYPGVINFYII